MCQSEMGYVVSLASSPASIFFNARELKKIGEAGDEAMVSYHLVG